MLAGRGCFELAFTPQENSAFVAKLKLLGSGGVVEAQADAYYQMLGRIRSEAADCSRVEDRQTIHQDIADTIGFVKLDRSIFSVLERWLEKQIQQELYKAIADGNTQDADTMQEARANLLAEQGNYRSLLSHPLRKLKPVIFCLQRRHRGGRAQTSAHAAVVPPQDIISHQSHRPRNAQPLHSLP